MLAHAVEDRRADVVYIEIDEARFRTEDKRAWGHLVIRVPLHIGETARARDAAEHGDVLAGAFRGTKTRFCVVSFTSDWLYPTRESRDIVQALNAVAANVSFVEIETNNGHDSFLLEEPVFFATIRGFLNAAGVKRGLKG